MIKKVMIVLCLMPYLHAELLLIDQTETIVYGPERIHVICMSDLERMGLDGKKRTLTDLIFEELWYQLALKFKVPLNDDMVDRYINAMMKQHNLTLDDIKQIFKASGYSYLEGREALRMMNIANMMKEQLVKSQVFVALKEVEDYYNANPVFVEARFNIQVTTLPFENDKDLQFKNIMQKIKNGHQKDFAWSDSFWIQDSEIAQDKTFIKTMKPGSISKPVTTKTGFVLYKLLENEPQHLVSLKDRYHEIIDLLRKPKFELLLEKYEHDLLDNAIIVNTN